MYLTYAWFDWVVFKGSSNEQYCVIAIYDVHYHFLMNRPRIYCNCTNDCCFCCCVGSHRSTTRIYFIGLPLNESKSAPNCQLNWFRAFINWIDILHGPQQQSFWFSIHQADGRLAARSREVSKPRDLALDLSNHSEIWQAPRSAAAPRCLQSLEPFDHYNI